MSFPATEEYFDVTDEFDRTIGRERRSVVHARKLLHRAVHIFVLNSRGELLLQLRSAAKDEYPNCYTSSASGHLNAGETYEAAAPRELREELGLSGPLEHLHKFPAGPQTSYEHTVLYRLQSDTPCQIDPHEIAAVSFHPLDEIAKMLTREPAKFSPCFVTLFEWYRTQPTLRQPPVPL